MNTNGNQRRLSAILAADMVGYTTLMEQDTEATVAAWKAARNDIIDPVISDHSGRIVKHTGDGFLAEFGTVQDAVKCAIEMQRQFSNGPLSFRMGINLGDIVDDGVDIHGEGVNIAARIEGFANPGGICISGGVYEQVRNQVGAAYEDIGDQMVKHVSALVRVYRVDPEGEDSARPYVTAPPPKEEPESRLDQDLELSATILFFVAPGLVVLGLFVNSFFPMLGVAALIACVAIGLKAAARSIRQRSG
jgi:class 3 adenylate cyclase